MGVEIDGSRLAWIPIILRRMALINKANGTETGKDVEHAFV